MQVSKYKIYFEVVYFIIMNRFYTIYSNIKQKYFMKTKTVIKTLKFLIGYRPVEFPGSDRYFPKVGSESQVDGNGGQQILPSSLPATINFN